MLEEKVKECGVVIGRYGRDDISVDLRVVYSNKPSFFYSRTYSLTCFIPSRVKSSLYYHLFGLSTCCVLDPTP